MTPRFTLLLLLLLTVGSAQGSTFLIRPDGTGAFPTVQAAIDAVAPGDSIALTDGTFTGAGNRDIDFHGKAITVRSESGDPTRSIIDCQGSVSDLHRGFVFQSAEGRSSLLEGITIRNGCVYDGGFNQGEGGGIFIAGASPTIQDCHVQENVAWFGGGIWIDAGSAALIACRIASNSAGDFIFGQGDGGGIYVTGGSSATISSCELIGNGALYGGGILATGTAAEISDCVISHNGAGGAIGSGHGGGIYAWGENHILRCEITNNSAGYNFSGTHGGGWIGGGLIADCLIAGNRADAGAGGIGLRSGAVMERCTITDNAAQFTFGGVGVEGDATLRDCVVAKNASEKGGGINVSAGLEATIERCTVTENSGTTTGGGIYVGPGATVTLTRTIVWGNCLTYPSGTLYVAGSLNADCSDLELAGIGGPGQITYGPDVFDADPLFCRPRGRCALQPLGDYHLDAASPAAPGNSPGQCGLIGALPVECGVASVAGGDSPAVPSRLTVRPNPVTSRAIFTIDGSMPGDAIEIYGPDGRLCRVLFPDRSGTVEWLPDDAASGVYLARLRGGSGEATKCLVLR